RSGSADTISSSSTRLGPTRAVYTPLNLSSQRFAILLITNAAHPLPLLPAHRSSHYNTQDIYSLFQLPVHALLSQPNLEGEGRPPPLIAVWLTNKPKFRRFVADKLFPAWGCEAVAEWYWIKVGIACRWLLITLVTAGCDPVVPLDSPHRKPYEPLLLGRLKPISTLMYTSTPSTTIPSRKAIISVPCRRHSRKPPLGGEYLDSRSLFTISLLATTGSSAAGALRAVPVTWVDELGERAPQVPVRRIF
ncbi:hypothetical protein BC936DRAFT_140862, partial [Jimgerdemannia flammicorona]